MNKPTYYSANFLLFLLFPFGVILAVILFLHCNNALSESAYPQIQKEWFYYLNARLSVFPSLQYNFTQIGDALVVLSLLSVFFVFQPKLWPPLVVSSFVSLLVSGVLKEWIDVYRPASLLDRSTFTIIGESHIGRSSCPSGHSITIFTTLAVLLFFFMPKSFFHKICWSVSLVFCGLMLAFSRVAVGAHYPLDVVLGCALGFACAVLGLYLAGRYSVFAFLSGAKFQLPLMLILSVSVIVFIDKIQQEQVLVYYFSLLSLLITLFLLIKKRYFT